MAAVSKRAASYAGLAQRLHNSSAVRIVFVMSLKGTWAQIYREDATGLGYTVAPTTMPLTISDDSNDIRDVGPCCGYEDYYAESPMLPTEIGRTDLKRWISTTMIRPEEEEGGRSALRSR